MSNDFDKSLALMIWVKAFPSLIYQNHSDSTIPQRLLFFRFNIIIPKSRQLIVGTLYVNFSVYYKEI